MARRMNAPITKISPVTFTDPLEPGTDKYLAKINKRFDAIDARFDDLLDRFNRMFDDRRRDIAKLRALVQGHIDRMDAESLMPPNTVCRERVALREAAPAASQSGPCDGERTPR